MYYDELSDSVKRSICLSEDNAYTVVNLMEAVIHFLDDDPAFCNIFGAIVDRGEAAGFEKELCSIIEPFVAEVYDDGESHGYDVGYDDGYNAGGTVCKKQQ